MNHIEKYNQSAAKPKRKAKEIIESLNLREGLKILEIGSGGGYFAEKFSNLIGNSGIYYGIDTDSECIEHLLELNKKINFKNINAIKISVGEIPNFDIKFDLIFSRNVYHHLSDRINYFSKFSNYLEDDGKIVIIDYDDSWSLHRLKYFSHYTKRNVVEEEMKQANYNLIKSFDFLPIQSFLIFGKK